MTFKYLKFIETKRLNQLQIISDQADCFVFQSVNIGPRILSITGSKHLYKYYDY